MNYKPSTDQHDSVANGDDCQRKKVTKTTRSVGFILVVLGLLLAFAVPAMLRQQAKSALNEKFSNSAGVIFDNTVRSDNYWTAQHNADAARDIGFIIVIAGVAVLILARNPAVIEFLLKQKTKR
jgi:hypothetical protein